MPVDSPSGLPREEADFVVVGAGFAGLTAALRLSKHGSVIVLEARDRVGGRVYTGHLPDGAWLDFGGTWFGPGQEYSYALAEEMGVGTYPTYTKGDALLVMPDGTIVRQLESFPLSELFSAAAILVVLEELRSMYQQVPLEAPWTAKKARDWDKLTFAGWVDTQLDDSVATAMEGLNTLMEGVFTSDTAEVSLLHVLYLLHSHQGVQRLTAVKGGDQQDRVVGGAQAIAEKVRSKLGDAVRLSSPVRQINQDARGVDVVADTVTVRAKRAIVTIPPTLSGHVRYEPALPVERALLVERLPSGSITKVLIAYEEPFWRAEGLNGQSMAFTDPVASTFDGCTDTGKPGLMIAFAFGHRARALARLPAAERRQTFLDALVKRFGPQAAHPVEGGYFEHDWSEEVWSGGGMIAHWPPGVITSFGPALLEPFGRIHWAGTETSTRFHGTINGAIESGERVAREVLAAASAAPS